MLYLRKSMKSDISINVFNLSNLFLNPFLSLKVSVFKRTYAFDGVCLFPNILSKNFVKLKLFLTHVFTSIFHKQTVPKKFTNNSKLTVNLYYSTDNKKKTFKKYKQKNSFKSVLIKNVNKRSIIT